MQRGAAASLVRSSATSSFYAHQPRSLEDPNLNDADVQPHEPPTPKQKAALQELHFFDKEKILAWLTVLRSIEPGFRYRASGGCLSRLQIDALSTLKDCDDGDILAWLCPSDCYGQHNTFSTSRSYVESIPRHQRNPSTNPSLRSSTSSLALSALFSNRSSYSTQRSSLGHGASLPELPEAIACNDESSHAHWCTHGEHPKPINTCEGWKRHEREHEIPYLCMPDGPVETTPDGQRCALCHKTDPDPEHLAKHRVFICVGKFREPLKKSRKPDMISHLAKHRVHSRDAAALADQWRYALNKRNFSCGLCVTIFSTIMERWNHIDKEHWRHGQNMDAWELSNCIRGLLLELKVQAAWRFLLMSHPHVVESNLRWELPLAEGLQLRLEKGEEPAPVLAKATLQLSNYGRTRPNQERLVTTMGQEEMMFDPISATSQNPAAATMVPLPSSMCRPLPGWRPLENVGTSSTDFPTWQCDTLATSAAIVDDSLQTENFFSNTFSQTGLLIDLGTDELPSQQSTHTLPSEWPPTNAGQVLDDNTQTRGHLIENEELLEPQISSSRCEQSVAYATLDGQGQYLGSRKDVGVFRLPASKFSHSSTAHHSNHRNGCNFRDKPLPPKPPLNVGGNADRAVETRPVTPMDLDPGSSEHCN